MHRHRHRQSARRKDGPDGETGFTLIELLVVITILGILAAIVVFSVKGIGDKGRANSVAADASVLRTAEEAYCAKFGSYGSIDDLHDAKLLASTAAINSISLGADGRCGNGATSSFSLYDASAPTAYLPGDNADGQPFSAIPVGSQPDDIAVNPATNMVYVLNTGDSPNTVSVIDGATDTVVGSPIPVGTGSDGGRIVVNPHDNKIYVIGANVDGSQTNVYIIDGAHPASTPATVPFTATSGGTPFTPVDILADPKTDDVYVSGTNNIFRSSADSSGIMIIDGANDTSWIAPTFRPFTAITSTGFALDTTTDTIYAYGALAGSASPTLAAIGGGGSHAVSTAALPAANIGAGLIAVNSVTNKIYTTGYTPASGSRTSLYWTMVTDGSHIDNTTVISKETASAPAWDLGIAVNTNANQFFVLGDSADGAHPSQIRVRDDSEVVHDLFGPEPNPVGLPIHQFAVNPNTNRVYYAPQYSSFDDAATGGLEGFDASTAQPTTLSPGRGFGAMAINPVTNKIYATDVTGGTVAVLQ